MNPNLDRPQITIELVERFAAYFRENPAWGSLHVVLDDKNLKDVDVDYCIEYAIQKGDREGEQLGIILRQMTKSQRFRIGERATWMISGHHKANPNDIVKRSN